MAALDLGMEPSWVALSYSNQSALHPEVKRPEVALDTVGYNMVVALGTMRRARLAAEREEERIKAEIAGLLGDAEVGTFNGAEIIRWSMVKGSASRPGAWSRSARSRGRRDAECDRLEPSFGDADRGAGAGPARARRVRARPRELSAVGAV
jgi:hypothetical protein